VHLGGPEAPEGGTASGWGPIFGFSIALLLSAPVSGLHLLPAIDVVLMIGCVGIVRGFSASSFSLRTGPQSTARRASAQPSMASFSVAEVPAML